MLLLLELNCANQIMSKWLKLTEIALRPANTFPGVKFSQWKNEKWECTLFSERNLPFLKYSVLETLGHWPWPNTLRNSPEWMVPATTFMKKGYWPWPRVTRKNGFRKVVFLLRKSVPRHETAPLVNMYSHLSSIVHIIWPLIEADFLSV